MAPRIMTVARGVRRRHLPALSPGLQAALATPEQDAAVEADLAMLPEASRATLLAGFAEEARGLARALGVRIAAGDGPGARPIAHALAGCAATFGRPRIAALARLAALAATQHDTVTARAALAALAEALPPRRAAPLPPCWPQQDAGGARHV